MKSSRCYARPERGVGTPGMADLASSTANGLGKLAIKFMQSLGFLALAIAISTMAASCAPEPVVEEPEPIAATPEDKEQDLPQETSGDDDTNQQEQSMTISITVGPNVFTAEIEETETGKAFLAKLPLTLDMSDLNRNEKYCYGVSLPRADEYYDSLAPGDLMLFSGNCIVLFYGPAGGYSYTRIGKLTGIEGLEEALGTDSVQVSFARR